ncbi:MAG TPA: aspartate-semialdehyde dehydrogenase, partial [Tenuifilaceae bacterium]|nr:aspartate-semialdehyde dehydrogenase [Tenuifilaceae bacterium]
MRIAVVGCTGLVGTQMLKVIDELNLNIDELIPVASERSAGKKIRFRDKNYEIVTLSSGVNAKPDVAI